MIYNIDHIADNLKNFLKSNQYGSAPKLDIVKTSNDFASEKYINNKIKLGTELGYEVNVITPDCIHSSDADGIIVQLPVGEGYDEDELIDSVPIKYDVDGFSLMAQGEIMRYGRTELMPCTVRGILEVIRSFTDLKTRGKHVVIINRSNIVGKPLAMALLSYDATVTICHSKTKNLADITRNADIVVTAVGKRDFITRSMLKSGALVVDVAINRGEDGKVTGDCAQCVKDADDVWTTPVPNGIGKLTVLNLLWNTAKASGNI